MLGYVIEPLNALLYDSRIKDMKTVERRRARELRGQGYSLNAIAQQLGVGKASVSVWVRDIPLTLIQRAELTSRPFTTQAIEKRRASRLSNEAAKREAVIIRAQKEIPAISGTELWLMGVMLYWAEGGKTQRLVRFSNGDPEMIKIMMRFFRIVCKVPESKFRGYIHIHPHLDYRQAEHYWSEMSGIPLDHFFKTYRKINISSQNKKNSLPKGVMDIYVLDSNLFLRIVGWAKGIFETSNG